jgi:hypothetical protein
MPPPPMSGHGSRSPPIRRRSPIAPDTSAMEIPSPSDEFLTQVFVLKQTLDWTMFWQDFISTFYCTEDLIAYVILRGKRKRCFSICIKNFEKDLNSF